MITKFIFNTQNNITRDPNQLWNFNRCRKGNGKIARGMTNIEGSQVFIVHPMRGFANSLNFNFPNVDTIHLNKIKENDFISESKRFKKLIGPNQIPSFMVKRCIIPLSEPITHIFI